MHERINKKAQVHQQIIVAMEQGTDSELKKLQSQVKTLGEQLETCENALLQEQLKLKRVEEDFSLFKQQ